MLDETFRKDTSRIADGMIDAGIKTGPVACSMPVNIRIIDTTREHYMAHVTTEVKHA